MPDFTRNGQYMPPGYYPPGWQHNEQVTEDGSSMDSNTNNRSVPKTSPTPVEVGDNLDTELYKILSDYGDDISQVKKRNGKLPADNAVDELTSFINQIVSKELEGLVKEIDSRYMDNPFEIEDLVRDRIEFYRGKEKEVK